MRKKINNPEVKYYIGGVRDYYSVESFVKNVGMFFMHLRFNDKILLVEYYVYIQILIEIKTWSQEGG